MYLRTNCFYALLRGAPAFTLKPPRENTQQLQLQNGHHSTPSHPHLLRVFGLIEYIYIYTLKWAKF